MLLWLHFRSGDMQPAHVEQRVDIASDLGYLASMVLARVLVAILLATFATVSVVQTMGETAMAASMATETGHGAMKHCPDCVLDTGAADTCDILCGAQIATLSETATVAPALVLVSHDVPPDLRLPLWRSPPDAEPPQA